jgi:hypothetical protein
MPDFIDLLSKLKLLIVLNFIPAAAAAAAAVAKKNSTGEFD